MCFDLSTFSIIKIWNIDKHKLISAAALYSDNDSDLFGLRCINQSVIVLMCLLLCLSDRLTASQTAFFWSRHGGIYKSQRVLYLLRNHAHFTQRLLSLDTMNVFKEPSYWWLWLIELSVNGRKKTRSCWRLRRHIRSVFYLKHTEAFISSELISDDRWLPLSLKSINEDDSSFFILPSKLWLVAWFLNWESCFNHWITTEEWTAVALVWSMNLIGL